MEPSSGQTTRIRRTRLSRLWLKATLSTSNLTMGVSRTRTTTLWSVQCLLSLMSCSTRLLGKRSRLSSSAQAQLKLPPWELEAQPQQEEVLSRLSASERLPLLASLDPRSIAKLRRQVPTLRPAAKKSRRFLTIRRTSRSLLAVVSTSKERSSLMK